MNDFQKQRFVERVISAMFNTISKKKIAVFGFAFKKDTGDTRETPAIDVCRGLMADGANVRAGVLQRREKREPSRGASAVAQACSVGSCCVDLLYIPALAVDLACSCACTTLRWRTSRFTRTWALRSLSGTTPALVQPPFPKPRLPSAM